MTNVWYAKKSAWEIEGVTKENMNETHIKLPYPTNVVEDEYIYDRIFSKFNNDYENPLSTPEGQNWLRENGVRHTSMSIGDIIEHDGKFIICEREGWRVL